MKDARRSRGNDTATGLAESRMLASISSITGASRLAEFSQFA
jgi:hypothetical protein